MNGSNDKNAYYKWLAGGLLSIVLVLVSAGSGHWIATWSSLTEHDVMRIIERDAVTENKLRVILREEIKLNFTDLSINRGMYAIEGRPRIEALEEAIHGIDSSINRMEDKIDDLKK
jgi:hypothetical protein